MIVNLSLGLQKRSQARSVPIGIPKIPLQRRRTEIDAVLDKSANDLQR